MLPLQKELSQIFLDQIRHNQMPRQLQSTENSDLLPLLLPKNTSSGKVFSAANTFLLWQAAKDNRFTSPLWATAEQWAAQDDPIKADEKGTKLYHFEDTKRSSLAWTTYVYNRCQLVSYDPARPMLPKLKALSTRVAKLKDFITGTGASIREREGLVNYLPARDLIQTPPVKSLYKKPTAEEEEHHYSQLLYLLIHWTGHAARCDRIRSARLFSKEEIFESLIALIGSSMLCARLEVRNANRIGGCDFVRALTGMMAADSSFFLSAAAQADKAVNFLSGFGMNAHHILKPMHSDKQVRPAHPAQLIPLSPATSAPHFRA